MTTEILFFARRFRYRISLRLLSIFVTAAATYFVYEATQNTFWIVVGGILVFSQIRAMMLHVERIARDLTRFLEAINFSDFTQTFRSPFSDPMFAGLYEAYRQVMGAFQETRRETETQRRYLENIVHHVGIGLLCYQTDGSVRLFNTAAKRLLERPALLNVNDLESSSPALAESLISMGSGEHRLVPVDIGSERLQVSLHTARFTLQNDEYILASLQNIGTQLEETEMDAMQHMTRILSHEIMNSMTPIVSLAALAREQISEHIHEYTATPREGAAEIANFASQLETFGDLQDALSTIEKRSEGLLHFVNGYREMARLPEPNRKLHPVEDLLTGVTSLLEPQLKEHQIDLHINSESPTLAVLADAELIEQVLINIIKNAMEAFGDQSDKRIEVEGALDRQGRVIIRITDNGPGIPDETLAHIFVPFFSTKASGSGIGLSFSRHIMRQHQGTLRAQSQPGGPTTFTLRF